LNTGPADYKSAALPTKPLRRCDVLSVVKKQVFDGVPVWFFSTESLNFYTEFQCHGLSMSSLRTIRRVLYYFFTQTEGNISKETLLNLSHTVWNDDKHSYSHKHKLYVYITGFIKYLAQELDDVDLETMLRYFRKPKTRREVKVTTSRIIVTEDIKRVIDVLSLSKSLDESQKLRHITFILFLAYGGQRPMTAERITAGQFKLALAQNPPVLTVLASQDKVKMEHYCPLHPVLIPYLTKLIEGKSDDERVFSVNAMRLWLYGCPQSLTKTVGRLRTMDLRKFFEQKSDELGFTDAHKNLMMSHGCSSINWTSYKGFLPEVVYARYIEKWGDVKIPPFKSNIIYGENLLPYNNQEHHQ
jgi:hypothetical protein